MGNTRNSGDSNDVVCFCVFVDVFFMALNWLFLVAPVYTARVRTRQKMKKKYSKIKERNKARKKNMIKTSGVGVSAEGANEARKEKSKKV